MFDCGAGVKEVDYLQSCTVAERETRMVIEVARQNEGGHLGDLTVGPLWMDLIEVTQSNPEVMRPFQYRTPK